MRPTTTLMTLSVDDACARVDAGAAFADLRPIADYLDVHIPGSLALLYEFGPGMAVRARDCLPLDLPLILLSDAAADMANAAAALRGKGFSVLGCVDDGVNAWATARGAPASTDVVRGERPPSGTLLDVGDPGARAPEDTQRIPIETLWDRASEAGDADPVVIVAGYGVRAALAVGILERAGRRAIVVWDTRPWRSGAGSAVGVHPLGD